MTGEYHGHWVPAEEGNTTNKVWEGTWPEKRSPLGDDCLEILLTIEGSEAAEATLGRAISGEEDKTRKKNMEEALSALSRLYLQDGVRQQSPLESQRHDEAVEAARKAVEARRQWDAAQ